jgi:hypothetical protein
VGGAGAARGEGTGMSMVGGVRGRVPAGVPVAREGRACRGKGGEEDVGGGGGHTAEAMTWHKRVGGREVHGMQGEKGGFCKQREDVVRRGAARTLRRLEARQGARLQEVQRPAVPHAEDHPGGLGGGQGWVPRVQGAPQGLCLRQGQQHDAGVGRRSAVRRREVRQGASCARTHT